MFGIGCSILNKQIKASAKMTQILWQGNLDCATCLKDAKGPTLCTDSLKWQMFSL